MPDSTQLASERVPRSERNPCLQGMRGLAAFTVVLYHVHYMSAKGGLISPSASPLMETAGPFSVLLFFCMSGFLIVGSLLRHRDLKRFALNRVLRIYPLFILLHVVMFTAGPVAGYEWMGQLRGDPWAWTGHFFSNLVFLPGLTELPIAQKNAWSLSFEAGFYVLATALFLAAQRRHTWSGRCMFALSMLACVEAVAFESHLMFFGVGVVVWWLDSRRIVSWPSMGPLSLLCMAAAMIACSRDWLLVAAVALIPVLMDVVNQMGWLAPLLASRTLGWMGKVSYSLYLVHPFVLDPLRRFARHWSETYGASAAHVAFVMAGVPLALAVAAFTHHWIEVKLTRRLAMAM